MKAEAGAGHGDQWPQDETEAERLAGPCRRSPDVKEVVAERVEAVLLAATAWVQLGWLKTLDGRSLVATLLGP